MSESLQQAIQLMPTWVQVALIILCADFVLYWEHRLYHEVSVLWLFNTICLPKTYLGQTLHPLVSLFK